MTGDVPGRHAASEEYRVVSAKATEPKVAAATGGAGLGSALALYLVWQVDAIFWNGDEPPGVPAPVSGLIYFGVPALVAYLFGRFAPHVERFSDRQV